MADELVLGATSQLLRPDALENFNESGSEETDVRLYVRGRAYRPAGEEGEATMRRLYIAGFHKAAVSMYVTPIVDGRWRNELRTYLSKPATSSGKRERFSFIVSLEGSHPDYPDISIGLRGNLFDAMIEMRDPTARIFLASLVYAHEPLSQLRALTPEEGGGTS